MLAKKLRDLSIPHIHEEFDDDHSSVDYRLDHSLPRLAEVLSP
jgi:hypothetical protein